MEKKFILHYNGTQQIKSGYASACQAAAVIKARHPEAEIKLVIDLNPTGARQKPLFAEVPNERIA